jgi:hypothetical protein
MSSPVLEVSWHTTLGSRRLGSPGFFPFSGSHPSACCLEDVLNHATANGTAYWVLTKVPTIVETPSTGMARRDPAHLTTCNLPRPCFDWLSCPANYHVMWPPKEDH